MDKAELKSRTKAFAVRIIRFAENLPQTLAGKTIARQIIRSGTSVAANYRAACRGRSRAEFVAKLGCVDLLEESNQITAIMFSARRTAAGKS